MIKRFNTCKTEGMLASRQTDTTGMSTFRYVLILWLSFFLIVFLPLELLRRLDSFLLSMSLNELAVSIAGMILFLGFMAVVLALLATSPASLFPTPLRNRFLDVVNKGSNYFVLILSSYCFSQAIKEWLAGAGHQLPLKASWLALLISAAFLLAARRSFHQRAWVFAQRTKRVTTWLVLLALIAISVRIGSATFSRSGNHAADVVKTDARSVSGKPNIILVTFDSLTAQDMSLHGYGLPTTPFIEQFALQSNVFEHAMSASNSSRPSMVSLLTGTYPSRHRTFDYWRAYNPTIARNDSLPAILKQAGYHTAAFISGIEFAHPVTNGLSPFFDYAPKDNYLDWKAVPFYEAPSLVLLKPAMELAHRYGIHSLTWVRDILNMYVYIFYNKRIGNHYDLFYPPEKVIGAMKEHLEQITSTQNPQRPYFIWLHIMPPHSPYLPPTPFKGTFLQTGELADHASQRIHNDWYYPQERQQLINKLRLRYDENIRFADASFGGLISYLRKTDRFDNNIIVMTADHGESFSHGFQGHSGPMLYEPFVHIPLLIHLPGQYQSRRIVDTVSQTDIMPTLLAAAGIAIPERVEGRSVRALLDGGSLSSMPAFSMRLDGNKVSGPLTKGTIAIREGHSKYIINLDNNRDELYDLNVDPGESQNLAKLNPAETMRFRSMVSERLQGGLVQTGQGRR
jgi:arylsulfatase A-like enzyme